MRHGRHVRTFLLAALVLTSTGALAQNESNRAGKFDSSLYVSDIPSKTITSDQGANANIDGAIGWGFNFGYNVDDHWNVGLDFSSRDADYNIHVTPAAGNGGSAFDNSGTLRVSTTNLTGTYYFSTSQLAPFVTAAIGRTWVDTNIPSGPPTNVCWYDPWWGYYCGPTVPTKSDSYWGYGGGIGVRWDSKGPLFLRASVNEQWLDVGGSVGTPSFTQYRFDLGAKF